MGSVIAYGYRMNERGRVVHRYFDLHDLQHGEASRNGWVDSPDKVPGFAQSEVNKSSSLAAHAHTTGREPKPTGTVYGETEPVNKPVNSPINYKPSLKNQKAKVSAVFQGGQKGGGKGAETQKAKPSVLRNAAGRAVDARGRFVKA
jgi:hypothetical protein